MAHYPASTIAEDPHVRVTDSPEVMLAKIDAYLTRARRGMFERVANTARQHNTRALTRNDRELGAVLSGISLYIGEMEAELLMPRELIGDGDDDRRVLRAKIDSTLQSKRPGFQQVYEHPDLPEGTRIPDYTELRTLRNQVIDADTFTELVRDLDSYTALLHANARVEELVRECEQLAARTCAHKCGNRAPLMKCDVCSQVYCGSACLEEHRTLNQCIPQSSV